MYIDMHTHIYICVCVCVCVYIYIYIHTYIQYIYIYIYMNQIDDRYRRDFNMNEMHVEPPFPCDYATSRNGCYDINGRK